MRTSILKVFVIALISFGSTAAFAQCAPGVPSAGNPGCIPPNQPNSPYYQVDPTLPSPSPDQAPARWAELWGAIAIDSVNGGAGAVVDQVSRKDARDGAINACMSRGGKECEVVIDYHNQCAAAAQSPDGGKVGTASGPTREIARDLAMKTCNGPSCKVIYDDCSLSRRVD